MTLIFKEKIPKIVYNLSMAGGLIVGSQAAQFAKGSEPLEGHDWDILVPFDSWGYVRTLIPSDATLNKFKGWRFTHKTANLNNIEVDTWPGDLQPYFRKALADLENKNAYALSLKTGILYSSSCVINRL